MRRALSAVLSDADLAGSFVLAGLDAIRKRHTCGHRVQELLAIVDELNVLEPARNSVRPHERIAS
jgi:hypothetical protein